MDGKAQGAVRVSVGVASNFADVHRFVSYHVMFTRDDFLLKVLRTAAHDNMRCLFLGLCGHYQIRDSGFL